MKGYRIKFCNCIFFLFGILINGEKFDKFIIRKRNDFYIELFIRLYKKLLDSEICNFVIYCECFVYIYF